MTEGAILVVDPLEELPGVLGRFEERLRWTETDTDEEFSQLRAAAEDMGALACLLAMSRFPPLLAPDGAELAPLVALAPRWRETINTYTRQRLLQLSPDPPHGVLRVFDQLQRSAAWSLGRHAGHLRGTLCQSECRLGMAGYRAYVGLVRATLDDPLDRWAALGSTPTPVTFADPTVDDLFSSPNRPERG